MDLVRLGHNESSTGTMEPCGTGWSSVNSKSPVICYPELPQTTKTHPLLPLLFRLFICTHMLCISCLCFENEKKKNNSPG